MSRDAGQDGGTDAHAPVEAAPSRLSQQGARAADRLDALVSQGAERWDAPAVALVRTLLRRAAELGEPAESRLVCRAEQRLNVLQEEFAVAKSEAGAAHDALVAGGIPRATRRVSQAALEHGRFETIQRLRKKHPVERLALRAKHQAPMRSWMQRIEAEAHRRGLSEPPEHTVVGLSAPSMASPSGDDARSRSAPMVRLDGQGIPPQATVPDMGSADASTRPHAGDAYDLDDGPSALTLASAIYRDAAADTSARLVVARAKASLPPSAGRYHAPTVAAHTLEALAAFAPGYLRVQVARLEAIGALEAVGRAQLETDEANKAAAKKKKAKNRRKRRKKPAEAPIADAAE